MVRAVLKIGGSVLKKREDLERIFDILEKNKSRENIIVVSALYGVTDMLINAFNNGIDIEKELVETHNKYLNLNDHPDFQKKIRELSKLFKIKRKSIETKEKIVSYGERLSSILLTEYLRNKKINARALESDNLLIAEGEFEMAHCNLEKSYEKVKEQLLPLIEKKIIPVITGFYGCDENGKVKTFGRGGSDYSAACIAKLTNADILEIWKDVSGFMSADPKIVKNAIKLDELSFDEAQELGYLGAKILHPHTIDVIRDSEIKVEIKSIFNPEEKGTILKKETEDKRVVKSIAYKKNLALINIKGGSMVETYGFVGRIFSVLAKERIVVDTIATSQANISFTVSNNDAQKCKEALIDQLQLLDSKIEIIPNITLIGIVGNNIKNNLNAIEKAVKKLKEINCEVFGCSRAADGINLSIFVKEEDFEKCILALHEELIERW